MKTLDFLYSNKKLNLYIFRRLEFKTLQYFISFKGISFKLSIYRKRYLKEKLIGWIRFLQFWPVYFIVWSRDCDCYETTHTEKFPTYYHAYKSMMEMAESAEGPFSFIRVSKKEYLEHMPEHRDHIMEAFENGNGNKVII